MPLPYANLRGCKSCKLIPLLAKTKKYYKKSILNLLTFLISTRKTFWQRTLFDKEHFLTKNTFWLRTLFNKEHFLTKNIFWQKNTFRQRTLFDKEHILTKSTFWQRTLFAKERFLPKTHPVYFSRSVIYIIENVPVILFTTVLQLSNVLILFTNVKQENTLKRNKQTNKHNIFFSTIKDWNFLVFCQILFSKGNFIKHFKKFDHLKYV